MTEVQPFRLTSLEEIEYRERYCTYFQDLIVGKDNCATCDDKIDSASGSAGSHPIFKVLQCKSCRDRWSDIDFNVAKHTCIMCGRISLYKCANKNCKYEYCRSCVTRNAKQCLLNAVVGDWKCFLCDVRPLWELRGVCASVIMEHPSYNCRTSVINITTSTQISMAPQKNDNRKVVYDLSTEKESDSSSSEKKCVADAEGEYDSRLSKALCKAEVSILKLIKQEEKRQKDKKTLNAYEIKIHVKKVFGALKIEFAERRKTLRKVFNSWRKKQTGSFYIFKKLRRLIPPGEIEAILTPIPKKTNNKLKKDDLAMEVTQDEDFLISGERVSESEKHSSVAEENSYVHRRDCDIYRNSEEFENSSDHSEKLNFSYEDDIETVNCLTSKTEVEFERSMNSAKVSLTNSPCVSEKNSDSEVASRVSVTNSLCVSEKNSDTEVSGKKYKSEDESAPEEERTVKSSQKKKFNKLRKYGSQKLISRSSLNLQPADVNKNRISGRGSLERDNDDLKVKNNLLKSSESSSDESSYPNSASSEDETKKRRNDKRVRSCSDSDSSESKNRFRTKKMRLPEVTEGNLKRSIERPEDGSFQSHVSLTRLEKRHKKSSTDSSSDENMDVLAVRKKLFRNRKSRTKTENESLKYYLEKVQNGITSNDQLYNLPMPMEIEPEKHKTMTTRELIPQADKNAKELLLKSSSSDSGKEMTIDDDEKKFRSEEFDDKTDSDDSDGAKKSNSLESDEDQKSGSEKSDERKSSSEKSDKETKSNSKSDDHTEQLKTHQDSSLISEVNMDILTDDASDILTDDRNSSEAEEENRKAHGASKKDQTLLLRIPDSDSDSMFKVFKDKLNEEMIEQASKEETKRLKELKKRRLKRMLLSESDSGQDSDSSNRSKKKTRFTVNRFVKRRKSEKKRKTPKKNNSDAEHELGRSNSNGLGTVRRKNIKKILSNRELDDKTKKAEKEEKERRERIAERNQKWFEEKRLSQEKKVEELVLDINEDTKNVLISVHKNLVKHLKPHQIEGIKFMWDACFESLERAKTSNGSGCILAHCMGLGKTFQVVCLSHTLITHKETGIKTILVLCPLSTTNSWYSEYKMWLHDINNGKDVLLYDMKRYNKSKERRFLLETWQKTGGVMIMSTSMFRILTNESGKKIDETTQEILRKCLLDPGPDLIVCDEGHLMKNENTVLSRAVNRVRTGRRIILTGTPLQNELSEYYCMVQFVKPNLLGTKTEFFNRFVNPINNGQCTDSDPSDVMLMKRRSFILHNLLKGCVQRFSYSVLKPFLPPKQEYVIFVRLTEVQIQMYQFYLENMLRNTAVNGKKLLADFHSLGRIWTHPRIVQWHTQKASKNLKKDANNEEADEQEATNLQWWKKIVKEEDLMDVRMSNKLQLLLSILKECEKVGEKLLVFSQFIWSLDLIEEFLRDWSLGKEYFRIDGQTNVDLRSKWCDSFNKASNTRARLFLISTKAGGVGINLTGATRVIIFDARWNPADDLQSIFRNYRFGQKKPCFVYRFVAAGTMEEKIYNRQVTKLSLACRVIDDQQIERHYTKNDLAELYRFDPVPKNPIENILNCPKDRLLAEIFSKYKHFIEKYLEHDSLLENKEDEILNAEDMKAAWEDYEDEKTREKQGSLFIHQ